MKRWTVQFVGAVGIVVLGASVAVAQTPQPTAAGVTTAAQTGQGRVLQAGDKARVLWSGQWYDATILEAEDGFYKVHYDGWGSNWDEWVNPDRVRLPDGGAVAAPPTRAKPVAAPTTPGTGTGLAPTTSRPKQEPISWLPEGILDGPPPSGAKPEPAVEVLSESPEGVWECRTWDYGQVNTVGGFTLRKNGRYDDLFSKKSGRYKFDESNGRIVFTSGPQKTDAVVTFFPTGHAGKGHIVLNYGGGAKLDCYRKSLR